MYYQQRKTKKKCTMRYADLKFQLHFQSMENATLPNIES